jgi:hypothetical protein
MGALMTEDREAILNRLASKLLLLVEKVVDNIIAEIPIPEQKDELDSHLIDAEEIKNTD